MNNNVIVALTSWRPRLPYVHLAINSILDGSIKPYKIVLVIYCEDVVYITKELQELIDSGYVELLICNKDIGCAKRWYYSMIKYKDNPILIIDDDIIYPKHTLEEVLKYHKLYPDTIIIRNGRHIILNSKDEINPFLNTLINYKFTKNDDNEANFLCHHLCGSGTLFPINCLNIDNVDIDLVNKYKQIDEVTMMYYALKNNIKSMIIGHNAFEEIITPIKNADISNSSLWKLNKNTNNSMYNDIGYNDLILPELQRLWNNGKLFNFNKPFITIVIPCYNPDKTLFVKLMDSIFSQSIGKEAFKITLIDDGSVTGKDILEKYSHMYSNIDLITLNETRGPGNARQIGLNLTDTEYVTFMDCDDHYIDENIFLKIYQHLLYSNCDMLIGNRKGFEYAGFKKEINIIKTDCDKKMVCSPMNVSPQSKIYKTSFLKENNLKWEDLPASQDRLFFYSCLYKANSVILYNEPIFVYNSEYNNTRITHTHDISKLIALIQCDIKLGQIFKNNNNFDNVAYNNVGDIIRRYKNTNMSNKEKLDIINYMKQDSTLYINFIKKYK